MGDVATVLCPVGGPNAALRGEQPFSSTLGSFEPLKVRSNVRIGYGPDEWRASALQTKVYPSPQLSVGRRAPTWEERAIDRWPTSHGRASEQERTKAFSGHTKSRGAHTEAPSGRTEAFSGRTESVSYVEIEAIGIRQGRQKARFLGDHQKPRLLVSFRSNAGEAVGDASPHEGVSQIGVEVEDKTVSAGGLCPSNENEEASRSKLGTGWEATGVNGVVLPVPEQEVVNGPSRQQKGTGKHVADIWNDTSQKSVEEALGLLKEQVEEDKRKLLASEKAVAAVVIADNRKLLKRSRVIAKQLISRSSARAIGFVSQMWVSARLCKVVALEVRPSLLSGEIDGVLLGDVCQVGDVILVSDESALESEMTALDCETLVGYDLVTEDGNYLGKVRDYSFNLQDGKVTSLEFDSLGFSLVPSSLVSTYRLDAEEVTEILSDSILVKQGVESRIRRLTKGFWQLPRVQEKAQSQKMARSRRPKRNSSAGEKMYPQSRQLPPSRSSGFLEEAELEGLDMRTELGDHHRLPMDYSSPRYKGR